MNKLFIVLVFAVLLLAYYGFRASFVIVNISGTSMSPTLVNGDRVLVFRWWPYKLLKRGQIVVVNLPRYHLNRRSDVPFIKRIVGLPGDQVKTHLSEVHEGFQQEHKEQYDNWGYRIWHTPLEHCFLIGDSKGVDSRVWGPVPFKLLMGLAILRLPNKFKHYGFKILSRSGPYGAS